MEASNEKMWKLTFALNFWSSVFVIVSAFAITGMMLTLESSFFMVTKSRAFILSTNTKYQCNNTTPANGCKTRFTHYKILYLLNCLLMASETHQLNSWTFLGFCKINALKNYFNKNTTKTDINCSFFSFLNLISVIK